MRSMLWTADACAFFSSAVLIIAPIATARAICSNRSGKLSASW